MSWIPCTGTFCSSHAMNGLWVGGWVGDRCLPNEELHEQASCWISGLSFALSAADCLDGRLLASDKTSASNTQANEEINIASSDSEVEIVGVQEHARCLSNDFLPFRFWIVNLESMSAGEINIWKEDCKWIGNVSFFSVACREVNSILLFWFPPQWLTL